MGPPIAILAPPIRAYFGDGPREKVPYTYPGTYLLHLRRRDADVWFSTNRAKEDTRGLRRLIRWHMILIYHKERELFQHWEISHHAMISTLMY